MFLDELPEFSKASLEALRQPLEDGEVMITRVNASLKFPSRMILVASRILALVVINMIIHAIVLVVIMK